MDINYFDESSDWNKKLLVVTHADRPTEPEYCHLNYLTERYHGNPSRLPPAIPFEDLIPISQHQIYRGTVTVWDFEEDDFAKPRLIAFLKPEYKPQHAIWYKHQLWILGVDRLEVFRRCTSVGRTQLELVHVVEDAWLSGAHTIMPDFNGQLILTCSGSDALLYIDEDSFDVTRVLRLPEQIYGHNYDLKRTDSVVKHYITNDLQLTHLNGACPWRDGVAVSMIIGDIGWFDASEDYHVLLSGFVGCHGIRVNRETEQIYFCDSCLGTVIFLDDKLRIVQRIATDSSWLHDAQQLDDAHLAVALTDQNVVQIRDTHHGKLLCSLPCAAFGEGPQFLYYGL